MSSPRPHPPNPLVFSLAGIPVWIVFALSLTAAIDRNRLPQPLHFIAGADETLTLVRDGISPRVETANRRLPSLHQLTNIETALAEALPAAKASTVAISSFHRREASVAIGTGVIISADGLVLTAGHVVDRPGAQVSVTLADGRELGGTALGISLYSDAGMVQINDAKDLPFSPVAKDHQYPTVKDWTFALGHPGGLDDARGVVLRIGRVLEMDPFTIRTSCKLLGGDSGGPLFDLQGRVIGINSRISENVEDNYHVSLDAFHRRWDALKNRNTLGENEGYVGVITEDATESIIIKKIFEHSAAQDLLEVGDECTHINGVRVASSDLFSALVKEHQPGEIVTLDILRGGETRQVELQLGEEPTR